MTQDVVANDIHLIDLSVVYTQGNWLGYLKSNTNNKLGKLQFFFFFFFLNWGNFT
jgi:hypothetical protein